MRNYQIPIQYIGLILDIANTDQASGYTIRTCRKLIFLISICVKTGVPQDELGGRTPFVKVTVSEHGGSAVQSTAVALNVYTPSTVNPVTLVTPFAVSPI